MQVFFRAVLASLFFISLPSLCDAQSHIAEVYTAEGAVELRKASTSAWAKASERDKIEPLDAIRTRKNSRAGVLFLDGLLVRLNERTTMEFDPSATGKINERPVRLGVGTAYFFSREPKKFPRINTPTVSASVRGTEFVVNVTENQSIVSVLEGIVDCRNDFGSVELRSGEEAIAIKGQAPVKRIMVKPDDAVEWALYYPAILSLSDFPDFISQGSADEQAGVSLLKKRDYQGAASRFAGNSWRSAMGRSLVAYQDGELERAFKHIEDFQGAKPAGMLLYLASLNASVGQVLEADEILEQARQSIEVSTPEYQKQLLASYYSLKSLIKLVQNDKLEALRLSDEAVSQSRTSVASALTRSYVKQAFFDLEESKSSLHRAVELEPDSALAKARLAEMHLGFGDVEQSIKVAKEALELSPGEVYPLTVLGFTYLSRYETDDAIRKFEQVLSKDTTSGLAHLGYGLALIRRGDLELGRVEIEKAVHLEPNVSVYRSYLGKVFYEQEREEVAGKEFERAKELDKFDPTPYLYGAFLKLSTYEPVAALNDLETSIRLNNNRAVYRSSFLLDQDNSVRTASLARTFNALGFAKAAQIEAIKSVSRDYTNYSAHSFLAESAGDDLSLAQSSISENIIAALLSPVNFNFILPNPSSQASLNEYTSLFDRPQIRSLIQGAGRTGDRSMLGEVITAGSTGDLAYSLRYNAEYSDGFRQSNDDARFQLFSTTQAYQITSDDKVFTKIGLVTSKRGSTDYRFDPFENDPDRGVSAESINAEAGYHHNFQPGSDLLAYFSFSDNRVNVADKMVARNPLIDFNLTDEFPPLPFNMITDLSLKNRFQGYRGNLQHILKSQYVTTVIGAEALKANVKQSENTPITSDEFDLFANNGFLTKGEHDEDAASAYAYATLHATKWLDFTLGADYTHLKLGDGTFFPPFTNEESNKDKLSPKVGAVVYVTPETTFRTAYFESIGVSGVADLESIQPTIVGGFTQVFDQLPGSSYSSYAFGLDHKWPGSTYIGTEFVHRNVKTLLPQTTDLFLLDVATGDIQRTTELESLNIYSGENAINSYIYQVLSDTLTATLEHSILKVEDRFFETELVSNKVRLALNYFHPSGWFGFSTATWRHQDRDNFINAQDASFNKNTDTDFLILGVGTGYQLPHRRGSIVFAIQNLLDEKYRWEPTARDTNAIPRFGVGLAYSINF